MKLFLDDIRFPREKGWTIVRNYHDFVYTWVLNKEEITHIAFDHDLGEEKTGYDALCVVEKSYAEGFNKLITMTVHSSNPVGVDKMVKVIKALELKMIHNHCK